MEVEHPANTDYESRLVPADHAAVEDQRGVRRTGVGVDPVDDRVASHLFLAVEREADVDRQRTGLGELSHRFDKDEHVPLVVGDAAGVQAAVTGVRSNGPVTQRSSGSGGWTSKCA